MNDPGNNGLVTIASYSAQTLPLGISQIPQKHWTAEDAEIAEEGSL